MTNCAKCGRAVAVYARIAQDNGEGFLPYCQKCATPIGAWRAPFIHQPRYVGPTPEYPMTCAACPALAVAQCQGCGKGFCERCWWKHSHRRPDAAAMERGAVQC
jgi:hypothetical protein